MCGILAYFKASGITANDLRLQQGALDAMRHRGPDGDGIFLVDTRSGRSWRLQSPDLPSDLQADLLPADYQDGQADLLLAHRRLSIFDLSSAGHQPMRDPAGNLLIFNGEVYNFFELRDELRAKGHAFHTGTDTEVILAAYREWGPACLSRFNGMWTMVLYDPAQRKILLSNDRVGIKQVYRFGNSQEWMLASEIKAIRHAFSRQLHVDKDLAEFFLQNSTLDTSTATLFQEVQRLPAGHYSHAAPDESPSFQPFWKLPSGKSRHRSLQDAAAELRHLLDDAIRLRMRADVPWGTTLSGGLDSSAIVYIAHALRKQEGLSGPINTFTASFPEQEGDETKHVRTIERDLGTHARYCQPLEEFGFEDFKRFLHHQDQPVTSTSMYAQWSVMKLVGHSEVNGQRIKVLLDGQGGDELFGGYHHHVYKLGRDLILRGKFGAYKQLVRDFCALKGKDPEQVKKFMQDDVKLYLKLKAGGKMPGPPENLAWNKARSLREVLRLDLQSWVMPNLLRYEDRSSMAFGIESRLPLLDYRIIEFAFQLPDRYKIHEGWQKAVLREAVPELPDSIRYRKDKKGFTTPQKDWVNQFRAEFEAMAQQALDAGIANPWGQPLADLHTAQLFRLANLGMWLGG